MQPRKAPRLIPRYQSSISLRDIISACCSPQPHGDMPLSELGHEATLYPSATDALYAYLMTHALHGEIIVPAYTCSRVLSAIASVGATPVFLDVDRQTGVMPPTAVMDACERYAPDAVIATHMFGQPPQLDRLAPYCRAHGIRIIEDAALSAPIAHHPSLNLNCADARIVSFGKGKLFSLGLGGLLIDSSLPAPPGNATHGSLRSRPKRGDLSSFLYMIRLLAYATPLWSYQVRLVSKLKWLRPYKPAPASFTAERIDGRALPISIESLLRRLLSRDAIEHNLAHRRQINQIYHDEIGLNSVVRTPPIEDISAFSSPSYPIWTLGKMALHAYLAQHGFDTGTYFDYCIGQLVTQESFPNSDRFAKQVLLLPNHQGITESQAHQLAHLINEWAALNKSQFEPQLCNSLTTELEAIDAPPRSS